MVGCSEYLAGETNVLGNRFPIKSDRADPARLSNGIGYDNTVCSAVKTFHERFWSFLNVVSGKVSNSTDLFT